MQRVIIEGRRIRYVDLTPEEEAQRLAESAANTPTLEETARLEAIREAPNNARTWFEAHSNARAIFSLSVVDLEAEIGSLVDALFPSATAGNRTRLKLLLTALTLAVRVMVKRERLD